MNKDDATNPGTDDVRAQSAEAETAAPNRGPDMEAAVAAATALAEENSDLKDRLMRAIAEMENLRKRTEREVRDAGQYAIAAFARDMLGVADNLQRALEAAASDTGDTLDSLREGVNLTKGELVRQLERHGVKPIAAQGQKFDPNLHQAIFEIPDPSVPAGTVLQVTQEGYSIGERVLRPAMVGVSKGGPKQAAAQSAGNDNAAGEDAGGNEHIDKTV